MKNELEKRTGFNFYRSYYDVLEDIHRDEDKLTYLLALLDKQFKGIEPSLTGIPKLVYNGQKHSIDKQVEGWENKKGVKLTPNDTPSTHPYQDPSEPPLLPPTEPPYEGSSYVSNDSVMTTEPPYEPPYLQEQEKGKEKEEEEEQVEVEEQLENENNRFAYEDIDMVMTLNRCSKEEAIEYLLQLEEKPIEEITSKTEYTLHDIFN